MTRRNLAFFLGSTFLMATSVISVYAGDSINLSVSGQTKCYIYTSAQVPTWSEGPCAGTGQDGEAKAGVAWPIPRFIKNADTTIVDRLTGLVWAPNGNMMPARDNGWDQDFTVNDGAVKWQRALDYIKKLNTENYLGHNDWRLPNLNELESLINWGELDRAAWLNGQGFTNVGRIYWSSTTSARATYCAWGVYFNSTQPILELDKSGGNTGGDASYVWPVRGAGQAGNPGRLAATQAFGPNFGLSYCYDTWGYNIPCAGTGQDGELRLGAWLNPRFTDNNNGTVADNLTRLIWTKDGKTPGPAACTPAVGKNWNAALAYIKCLNTQNYLGFNDWRLPNVKELRSKWAAGPFINGMGGWSDFYWSSTTDALHINSAWMSYGQSNNAIAGDKTSDYGKWVWPVRDSPDLVIGELRAPSACVGQTIAINDTILNTGKLPAGPSTTKYFLSDRAVYYDQAVLLGSRAISAIAGGSSQSGTTVVTIPPTTPVGPAHFIIARADANGAVAEGNETNNDASHAINIVGPGPDLAIINLWVCRDTNGKAFMGARVESEGVSPAGKAKIKFYVSRKRALDATAVYLGSAEVPPLAIHGIATPIISAATFPTDIPVDNAYVIGHLETSPMSHECNEENNTFIKQFKVERCSSVPAAKPQKGILR